MKMSKGFNGHKMVFKYCMKVKVQDFMTMPMTMGVFPVYLRLSRKKQSVCLSFEIITVRLVYSNINFLLTALK